MTEQNATAVTHALVEQDFEGFLRSGVSQPAAGGSGSGKSLRAFLDLAESYRITQVLRECHGNRSAAARALGIGRRTLYAKMDKLGLSNA